MGGGEDEGFDAGLVVFFEDGGDAEAAGGAVGWAGGAGGWACYDAVGVGGG